ncbi:uncharacterized protein [Watersipora subatra]|uniref:uncharacterized protein isoform X2 n=1 Tax=Watersipora subatra TaxID=2589382 RepID=UPI00355B7023
MIVTTPGVQENADARDMISRSNIPPYNRFDKIPCHALQCGVPQSDTDLIGLLQHRTDLTTCETEVFGDGRDDRKVKTQLHVLGSTGSGQSLNSIESAHSQDTNNGEKTTPTLSENSITFDQWTDQSSHGESLVNLQGSANGHMMQSEGPSRRDLPKKSKAAQQSVAELLNQTAAAFKAFGECFECNKEIASASDACQAMGQIYHSKCFTCCSCGRTLREKAFYCIQGRVYCEEDYMYSGFQQTSDKCYSCGHLVMDMVLQAMGKSFHPGCFRCTECNECLDGIPFTVDINNKVYCVRDFHKLFAPKCASCKQSIVPINGSEETVRVVALDKDYHVDCYHCERCKTQLTDEIDKRCYPIGDRLLCYDCHIQIRSSCLPSPGASSTSSSHSTNSSASYRGSPSGAPRSNGKQRRTIPLAKPSGLLQSTIPEELPGWAKPTMQSLPKYSNNNQNMLKQPLPTPDLPWNAESISDPNLRLQQKIKGHVIANEDFKLRLKQNVDDHKPKLTENLKASATPPANIRLKPRNNPQSEVASPFRSVVSPSDRRLHANTNQAWTSNILRDQGLVDEHKQHVPLCTTQGQSNHPVVNRSDHFAQPPKDPNEQLNVVAPRAAPIDHAIPYPNPKRVHSPRRRLPLSDVIMHQKIAESLRKSLESGTQYPSPEHSHVQARSAHTQGSKSPSPNRSLTRVSTSRTPSPPHYMKVWHASEIARSSPSSAPLAIPQEPVLSQSLPPRRAANDVERPPARPPKLNSLQITKI